METILYMDMTILWFIRNNIVNDYFTWFMKFVSNIGNSGIIWILITLMLIIYKPTRRIGIICAIALVEEVIVCNGIIKHLVKRGRPWTKINGLNPLVKKPTDYSFPSGHSSSSFAVGYTMLRKGNKKIGIPAIILAILIAFSRLYVAVHFPSDVVTGIIIGIIFSYVGEYSLKLIEKKNSSENKE